MLDTTFPLIASLLNPADPALAAALGTGVDGVVAPFGNAFDDEAALRDALAACAAANVPLFAEVSLDRFPADHALVTAQPGWFHIPRREANPALMAPDTPAAAFDARARITPDNAAEIAAALGARLAALVGAGLAGFRLAGLEQADPAYVAAVAEALCGGAPEAVLIGGPLGAARGTARALGEAGLGWLVNSAGYWNLDDAWLVEEVAAIRGAVPLLAEVRPEQLYGADEPWAAARRLLAAAAAGAGLIAPAGVLADAALVERLRAAGDRLAETPGELRRLTPPGATVLALLRCDSADVRTAGHAVLVLANRGDEDAPAPAEAGLIEASGVAVAAFARDDGGDPFAPLAAGEVRLLTATLAPAIRASVVAGGTSARAAAERPRLVIQDVEPAVAGGGFAVRRVVGEQIAVSATIFADGHEQLAAELLWRATDEEAWTRVRMAQLPNDLWTAAFTPQRLGRHEFAVEAWLDRFGGFRRDFAKKLDADVAQAVDHLEGRALIEAAAARGDDLGEWPARLSAAGEGADGAALLLSPELTDAMDRADDRPHRLRSTPQLLDAERLQARFSSWYELFPRSMSGTRARHGTFADVIDHLPRIRDMGFDTLYFPPIHPIGTTNRKGPNNTLTPAPGDPGSPYAIGSPDGGHDAIHPELGSVADFAALVDAARDHGLEIAIDFAIQCSPDHPWLRDHSGWFAWRPDGSMKYAENPPKKYQDIVNVDFYADDAVPDLWLALRDVVLLWARHGVRTFRVDNPHTKPLPFWEWMIAEVRGAYPDAIFLAEAFTRPAMMYRLAKIGFSQSYTYFTWRDTKAELTSYIEELTETAPKEFYRPHFFVNTPDINPIYLQGSGRPGFRIRAVLAATLSGLFGVYSGFELCEDAALPGREEYLDSEKYELRPRDWAAPGNIVADITLLNRLRRAYPPLQTHLNTRFYHAGNEQVIYYGKPDPDGGATILVMVNLDPHAAQDTRFEVPLRDLGLPEDGRVAVEDLARGYRFEWEGRNQSIRLEPDEPYRIWRVSPAEDRA